MLPVETKGGGDDDNAWPLIIVTKDRESQRRFTETHFESNERTTIEPANNGGGNPALEGEEFHGGFILFHDVVSKRRSSQR